MVNRLQQCLRCEMLRLMMRARLQPENCRWLSSWQQGIQLLIHADYWSSQHLPASQAAGPASGHTKSDFAAHVLSVSAAHRMAPAGDAKVYRHALAANLQIQEIDCTQVCFACKASLGNRSSHLLFTEEGLPLIKDSGHLIVGEGCGW